jgi:polyphosphate kinase 2 (PPK2 family)
MTMTDTSNSSRFLKRFVKKHGLKIETEELQRLQSKLVDAFEGESEDEWEDLARALIHRGKKSPEEILEELVAERRTYMHELRKLQGELIKLQDWVVATQKKVLVIFEGRDAAGKGGAIKRITQRLNPRVVRVVALPRPTATETTQWYFQRYVRHLPAAGEIVLFDRSWYNRAGVRHRERGGRVFQNGSSVRKHAHWLGHPSH